MSFKESDGRTVWVFDKKSLDFLGSADEALLDVGVADKPGETPTACLLLPGKAAQCSQIINRTDTNPAIL